MPQHLGTGFEGMPVMRSFVWVAELDGHMIGALLAAPCHGLIFIMRIKVEDKAPPVTALLLFRNLIRDAKIMGFRGYFSYIDPRREEERAFIPICRRARGIQVTTMQVPLAGSIAEAARF